MRQWTIGCLLITQEMTRTRREKGTAMAPAGYGRYEEVIPVYEWITTALSHCSMIMQYYVE